MEKTRAVAYIRVSTERDAQLHSYEFQEHYWQSAFEDDPNTDLIGIYADKGSADTAYKSARSSL